MRFVFWLVTAFLVSCTIGTESEVSMVRDTGEMLGPNTPRPVGWSESGKLSTISAAGARTGKVISMQQLFPAGEYTLQFDLQAPVPRPSNQVPAALATIEWACGGNTVTRQIVISSGTTISGIAEGVRVRIEDISVNAGGGAAAYEYDVRVTLARGLRASESMPLATPTRLDTVFVGINTDFNIPQNVGVNQVLVLAGHFLVAAAATDLTYKDLVVRQLTPGGTTAAEWKPLITGATWIPVVPGAVKIRLICTRVNGQVDVTTLFGVDG